MKFTAIRFVLMMVSVIILYIVRVPTIVPFPDLAYIRTNNKLTNQPPNGNVIPSRSNHHLPDQINILICA